MSSTAAWAALGQGFATGMGLIVAIGAQNSFVLAQGIRRNHHLRIALICIACDALLIAAGSVYGASGAWMPEPPPPPPAAETPTW